MSLSTALSRNADRFAVNTVQRTVLVVGEDDKRRDHVARAVEAGGWLALTVSSASEALDLLESAMPSLVVLTVTRPDGPELKVLDELRAHPDGERVPAVVVLRRRERGMVLEAFGRRADDVITGRPSRDELIARLAVRMDRPPLPRSELVKDPVTGSLTSEALERQVDLELERVSRGGRTGTLAYLALDELPALQARLGSRARDELLAQLVRLIDADGRQLDYIGFSRGVLMLLLPGTPAKGAQIRLERLSRLVHRHEFSVAGAPVHLTPLIGHAQLEPGLTRPELEDRAWTAMSYEAEQLDLHPTRWQTGMSRKPDEFGPVRQMIERFRTPLQVGFQQLLCLLVPFSTYAILDSVGLDITGPIYLVLVVALAFTAGLIWMECLAARDRPEPPPLPPGPPPKASAIIAAYLPNEAETVVETVESFLATDYPDLQIILAYNTPRPMAVERELWAIAERDPRFEPLRVEGSVSKAQNVNAAVTRVRGEFVGMFDADHHPRPGSFHRAWRWLAAGVDVVQGHCVVRNGDQNWLTRLVAAEFEVIYAVSHPGRARLHDFGIFGGSNGYWRSELLEHTRMRGFMLTEDIDSSLRVVAEGGRIVSDPGLISTELAPDTARALWNQRLRWAQGWSQVSMRHLPRMVRRSLSLRQRLGAAHLLGWREMYPWLSQQVAPLFAYWLLRGNPPINWFIPVFVVSTIFTMSAGPVQTWYAWRFADPSVKQHRRWFWLHAVAAAFVYTEAKNVVARTAHIKELMRERKWKVTPRSVATAPGAHPGGTV
jgi:cellulose synthase/poly-beta-1,6-N-acetylglucosamine synthase-like glycosyltransferase/DNA-binding response OmpR family regulator